jgi:hypothetical protein
MRTINATRVERISAAADAMRDTGYEPRHTRQASTTRGILYALQRKAAPVAIAAAMLTTGEQVVLSSTDISAASASTPESNLVPIQLVIRPVSGATEGTAITGFVESSLLGIGTISNPQQTLDYCSEKLPVGYLVDIGKENIGVTLYRDQSTVAIGPYTGGYDINTANFTQDGVSVGASFGGSAEISIPCLLFLNGSINGASISETVGSELNPNVTIQIESGSFQALTEGGPNFSTNASLLTINSGINGVSIQAAPTPFGISLLNLNSAILPYYIANAIINIPSSSGLLSQGGQLTTSPPPLPEVSTMPGSSISNPYPAAVNGEQMYRGPGFYELPDSRANDNPSGAYYVNDPAFINAYNNNVLTFGSGYGGSTQNMQPTLSISGTPALYDTVTINVSGLTPNGTWILTANNGMQLTQPHSVDSNGTGSLSYYITRSSSLYTAISQGWQVDAKDNYGIVTPYINLQQSQLSTPTTYAGQPASLPVNDSTTTVPQNPLPAAIYSGQYNNSCTNGPCNTDAGVTITSISTSQSYTAATINYSTIANIPGPSPVTDGPVTLYYLNNISAGNSQLAAQLNSRLASQLTALHSSLSTDQSELSYQQQARNGIAISSWSAHVNNLEKLEGIINATIQYNNAISSATATVPVNTQGNVSLSGNFCLNCSVNVNVQGLTPNSTWILYAENGMQLTRPHALDSTGSGAITAYELTMDSPVWQAANQGWSVYARDSSGKTTAMYVLPQVVTPSTSVPPDTMVAVPSTTSVPPVTLVTVPSTVTTTGTLPPIVMPKPEVSISGTAAVGNDVSINVSGLMPNSTWILYASDGVQLTQPHPVDANGNGVIGYDITRGSPLEWAISQGFQVYAQDSSGAKTSGISL